MLNSSNSIRPRKTADNWTINTNNAQSKGSDVSVSPILVNFSNNTTRKISDSSSYIPLGFTKMKISTIEEKISEKSAVKKEDDKDMKFKGSVKKYAQDFCNGTSLHGLRYVGMEDVSFIERLFWILSFIAAVGFSTYFINHVYIKWDSTPVIVGVNPKFRTISSIPFPAITICNMNQVRKKVAYDIFRDSDEVELILLDDVCKTNNQTFENITEDSISKWEIVKRFMLKVNQPCTEMIVNCQWKGVPYPCSTFINPALTDEGVCCTFNKVASKFMFHHPWQVGDFNITFPENNIDWTPEQGYPENSTADTWPLRPEGAGSHLGLTIVADVNSKDYYCSSTNSVGLKVRLHSPVESPMIKDFGFFLHPRKEIRIGIIPSVDEASPTINDIPIYKRQCLFSNERELYFYRTYTKNNCEMECISNYTLAQCQCVPYYLPKNIDTKICGKKKEVCYLKARADMEVSLDPQVVCHCLPACYEISYGSEVSMGDISISRLRKPYASQTDINDIIVLHFFFSHTQFRSYQKSELFGFTEFLSNSGGLLGLFLGFSFLSAVEIVYHLTLKLWCIYYRQHTFFKHNSVYPFAK